MSIKSSNIVNFGLEFSSEKEKEQGCIPLDLHNISDNKIIELIVKDFSPRRRMIAGSQIKIYFTKIMSHPGMRLEYIEKIKQLVIYEKNLNKNE